jgi:hypothetical protein
MVSCDGAGAKHLRSADVGVSVAAAVPSMRVPDRGGRLAVR